MTRFLVHFEKAGGNENPPAFGIYTSYLALPAMVLK